MLSQLTYICGTDLIPVYKNRYEKFFFFDR